MSDINIFFNLAQSKLKALNKEQLMLAMATVSIFMPFFVTFIMLIVTVIFALSHKSLRCEMFKAKSNIAIYIFSILIIFVPLFYRRYISVIAGIGIIFALIFFLFAKYLFDEELFNFCMDICCFSSVIPFIISIIQKLTVSIDYRTTGGMLNANYYGTICEIVIIIAVCRAITQKKYRNIYFTVIAMNIVGIFLCDCQSAWLAAMVGILILIFFNTSKKCGYIFLVSFILLAVIGIVTPGLLPRMELMPQTFSTRMNIWTTAFKGIQAHPFLGQGTLTYLFICDFYNGYKTYHAHSLYIDPVLSYGIVGAGIMLGYSVYVLKHIVKNIKNNFDKTIMSLVLGVIFAVCIHGITDFSIMWVQTGMLVFLILAGAFCKKQN